MNWKIKVGNMSVLKFMGRFKEMKSVSRIFFNRGNTKEVEFYS